MVYEKMFDLKGLLRFRLHIEKENIAAL